jgi:hypothetical protein
MVAERNHAALTTTGVAHQPTTTILIDVSRVAFAAVRAANAIDRYVQK